MTDPVAPQSPAAPATEPDTRPDTGPGAGLAPCAALLGGVPEPVLLVGTDRRIRIANAAAHELLGPRLEGQSALLAIRQPEPMAALERATLAAPGTRVEARYSLTTQSAETTYRMVAHRLAPTGDLDGVLVSFLDISHVEEAEQMRRDFIANVSHELRSPLTVLSGFIETLQGSARDDSEARARFLDIMAQEARRMNRLVGDLLSLSKVEANERVRPRERVCMADVIRTSLAALRPQIEENGIRVTVTGAEGDTGLAGDRDQLVQVVHNLVENAIKYGGAGGTVRLALALRPSWPGFYGEVLTLAVTDEGEGIDPIHLPRLTERFYRVDSHRSRQMGGTGLGLAIVKHIVNRHRGRLSIESERGKGTTFLMVLPRS